MTRITLLHPGYALLPKEFRIKEVELPDMTDEELANMLSALRTVIAEQKKQQGGDGGDAAQEPDEPRH